MRELIEPLSKKYITKTINLEKYNWKYLVLTETPSICRVVIHWKTFSHSKLGFRLRLKPNFEKIIERDD